MNSNTSLFNTPRELCSHGKKTGFRKISVLQYCKEDGGSKILLDKKRRVEGVESLGSSKTSSAGDVSSKKDSWPVLLFTYFIVVTL